MIGKKDATWMGLVTPLEQAIKALNAATFTINNNITPKVAVKGNTPEKVAALQKELHAQTQAIEKLIINKAQPAIKQIQAIVPQVEKYTKSAKGLFVAVEATTLVKRTKECTNGFQEACNDFQKKCEIALQVTGKVAKDAEIQSVAAKQKAMTAQKHKMQPFRMMLVVFVLIAVGYRMVNRFSGKLSDKWNEMIERSEAGADANADAPVATNDNDEI